MEDDDESQLSVDPHDIGWRDTSKPNDLNLDALRVSDSTEWQLAGDYFESKSPDTLNSPVEPHKLDRQDSMRPNDLSQDVIVGKNCETHNPDPDTCAINVLFPDFPDAPTSVWTTHDSESSVHDTISEQD